MPENPIITPITFDPNKQLTSLQKGQTNHLNIEASESFGLKASDFGVSQYDKPQETSWDELRTGDYSYLRGERQGLWDKAGNGLVNMLGKTLSTAAEGIANPFYGTIAALTHTDKNGKWDPSLNSYYNNDLTQQLDKFNEAVDKNNPFYSDKEESTDKGLAKLWHANTLFRDILGGAGTTIGAGLTGGAWSKAFSIFGKAMGAAQTAEEATMIANAVKEGATESLKSVANAATKKQIKDGIRQGTIAAMSATGEAGAEAREAQKSIYLKLTTNPDGSPKSMTEGELAYAKMMSEQAGDMAFGMNLPVIMADNWLTFGKALFGNKTNDFAKIANKTTFFDEATKTWKAVEKGKYANLGYRAGKIGVPMLSEGNQEILQFGIGKAAEDYYVNKYYNPNAANFLDSFTKGMAEAYTTQEGIHAGIIGALSAGIASPGMVLVGKGRKAFKDEFITNPEDKLTAQAVESLNKYKVEDLRKKFVDNFVRSANLTEIKDQAIDENNDFNYHNANEDMLFSYAYNRLQNGKLNDTKEELNNFKDLTVEELKNVYGIDVNVENKASIEQLTGKGAVQKYVQDRLDKLAKIEETYNQVTKLFPEAHPDVKELLIYSAQGLENAKQRKTEVAAKVTKILQENSEAFTSIGFAEALLNKESKDHNMLMYSAMDPKSFAKAYNELDAAGKKLFKKQITEADGISPLHQEEILKALDDVENLKSREIDFTLTYNALKDPKNQAIFLNASDNLWGKFYDLAKAKDLQDVQEVIENEEQKPTENPTPAEETQTSPVTSTTTEPVETTPTETPVDNTNIPPVDASDVTSNIPAATFGFTQPVQQKPKEEVKTTNDKHLMLNTPAEARDTQVLYTDKEGKQHLVGEYRTNEENQLDSFDDVRQALEYFKSTKEDKSLVHFIEVNGFVMLQIANVNISTISKYGGSPEQKAISALFYNPDGSIKSLEEINNLYQAGVIQLDLTKHLNTLLKDDTKPTLGEAYDMLVSTADTVKLKQGITDINLEGETEVREYDPSIEEAIDQMSELQSDIAQGLHVEVTVDGRTDVIKVKTKTNPNAQESFDEVVNTITNSQGDSKVIKDAIDKFNETIFFALEPVKGVVRKFQLNYSVKTNTFYFTLQTKDKNSGSYSAPVQMKNSKGINILNNIHPSLLSADYVIDQLADSNVNKTVKFSAKNIRYSSFLTPEGEVDMNKLEVYVDPKGLFKYGVQFSINAEAKPLPNNTPTSVANTPVETITDVKVDIERRRQEDKNVPVRQSVKYKLQNKIAGIDNPTPENEIPTLSEAIKIAGAQLSTPIKINEGEITHVVFDQEESMFRFTYKGKQFAAFYIANARGNIRWEITKLNDKTGTYQNISLDELKNINEKYGSQKDLLLSLGAKNLVEDIENFEKVEYSKEDKSSGNGIIPLENTVSAEQVRLGKKYGVTYTLEDFLKQYDAELAALEEDTKEQEQATSILAKLKQAQKEATSFKDLLNQQQQNTNEESDPDPVFSIGLEESTGITQAELDEIQKILPRFISIEDIKTIANNLKVKGIPYGAFKNKVIYLNKTKGKPGTAYHEAFHAVFRTMLTDAQIEKYYAAAYSEFTKSGKNLQEEVDKLRGTVANYTNKSKEELESLVLEEFMADKFMDYSMNKNQEKTSNILKQLFFKIKNFFKELFNIGTELDMLFDNILKGKFANAEQITNTYFGENDTVFKLLPKKNNSQENGFFNASDSRKIINFFAIQIYKAKTGDPTLHEYAYSEEKDSAGKRQLKSDEELLDYFINKRIEDLDTKGVAYGESLFTSNPELAKELANKIASEKYLYDKNNMNNVKLRPYEVLRSAVSDKLSIFNFKASEEVNEETEGGLEAVHMKDTFGSQDSFLSGGHDSLSQTIKKYVAFTTRIERDEITNEDREVGVDEVALYNGLTSVLADTSEERMIAKLYDASESNSNIKAFYEQIIKDLGITFDPETRTTTYPTTPEASNITRALLTNFKNSKATQIDVLIGESWIKDKDGKPTKVKANTWNNANKNDAKKISLERWKNRVTFISREKSIKEFQHNFSNVDKIVNNYYKGRVSLDKASNEIKKALDANGITLTSIYIKISLAKQKAILKPDDLIAKDKAFISIYDTTEPMDFKMFGAAALNDGFSIIDVINKDLKALFDEENGVLGRLGKLAENNAKFDESIANFSFTNAEGKKVYEIIKPSYVLSRAELYKKDSYWESVEKGEGLTEVEKKNTFFLRNNFLVTNHKELLKDLKINILSGFRDTTVKNGKTKDGVTFGSFDARTYLLSALTLYHNKGNTETGKYLFRQNEASSTGYVAELPKIDVKSVAGQAKIKEYFLTQVTKEWERIKREKKAFDKKPGDLKGYNNSLKGRAFNFTEFQYLRDTMGNEAYENLVKSALDPDIKELTSEQINAINNGVQKYLQISFKEFKNTLKDAKIHLFLTTELKGGEETYDPFLYSFYINDYIMSNSLNELMDGDYALSRKDKVDISKRNKGAMASGPDYGRGTHNSAIIKDINLYTSTVIINNKLVRVKPEFDASGKLTKVTDEDGKVLNLTEDQIASYTSNDAMSYSSQYHLMMGAFRLGRVDGATRKTYKDIIQFTKKVDGKVVRNVNIGDKAQKALSEALASLNSKKTIVFDGINGQYLKMSELGLIRSAISYIEDKDVDKFTELTDKIFDLMIKDDYESVEYRNTVRELTKLYKPVPGMKYWHNLANNMDLHEVDHLAVESASKGATRSPQDSQADDLDLSKSRFKVYNSNKRLQVETPTGKKEIVTGSQILTLIASELKDNEVVNGVKLGDIRKKYNEAIADTRDTSFKRAMRVIKEVGTDGNIDKTQLDEVVKRSLAASGADEQLLEFFDTPLNYNMVQMITKAEQVILSYFSKGVLNQKVNGDKVSLASDAGVKVVRDKVTGEVISHHTLIKDPAKYNDTTKYEESSLRYNVEEGDLKYSECMLSQTILTRHGLKIGDTITPEMTEVLKMLGYRIPTGDKQSAMSLKVVSLLPDYYNGIGIFPSEIVHLSGADFDIDSEFIQMSYFWYRKEAPTVPIKYGTEKTLQEAFEAFKFYNLNYDKDFSRDYNQLLKNDFRYNSIKKAVKQIDKEIDEVGKKEKQPLILASQGLKGELAIIEKTYYEQVSKKYDLPYTEKSFVDKGKKPNAVNSNIALDNMIKMLANNHTAEIANNTTSTDVLKALVPKLKSEGFIKSTQSTISQKNKSASDINGKYDANSKNSAGKDGIGIAANKIQQFAFLMSKVGDKVVKFNEDAFRFEIAGETGGSYSATNKQNERIANNLNILLNVFTDNAKDPIAGELNIQFELLGGFTELIMQGMSFENAVKFINLPIIQEYGKIQKALVSKVKTEIEESFNKANAQASAIVSLENNGEITKDKIEAVNRTISKIDPELTEVTLEQIENILLGKEFTKNELGDSNNSTALEVQYQALNQFVKIQEQYNVMATLNTFLTLNQGLETSFTVMNQKLHKAIDTFELNKALNTADRGLAVGQAHIDILPILKDDANTLGNIKRALQVSTDVGQKIFIEQTELFTKEFSKLFDSLQDRFTNVVDNVAELSREFLGYLSVKSYVNDLEKLRDDVNTKEVNKQAIQKRLDSLNLGLIFNELNKEGQVNLVSQLELLKSNPTTKDNYIVKYFTIKENIIDTKSFVKESNETISLLIDSVKSLWYDNQTQLNEAGLTPRNFVDNMLSYLMVKDNMTFKNNSVAKYLPVNMFNKYSETLDDLVKGLVAKNPSIDFGQAAYNFRKMYITDVNTTYAAMHTHKINVTEKGPIRMNGDRLVFEVSTNSEQEFKDSKGKLKEVFPVMLKTKNENSAQPTFKFPQFIKVRIGEEYQFFELESFTNKATGFVSKQDDFLNYIDATNGHTHNTIHPYGVGEKATYKPLEQIGMKGVSVYFPGTYDTAKALFDQVTPEEVDKTEESTPINLGEKAKSGKSASDIMSMFKKALGTEDTNVPNATKAEIIDDNSLESEEKEVSLEEEKATLAKMKALMGNTTKAQPVADPKTNLMKVVVTELVKNNKEKIDAILSPEERSIMNTRFKNATTFEDFKSLRDDVNKIVNDGKNPFKC